MNDLAKERCSDFPDDSLELASFYQTILGQSEVAIYVIGVSGEETFLFEDANESVTQLAGRPVSEICGRRPHDCLPVEIADCLETHLRLCLEAGENFTYERTLDLADGRKSWKTMLMPVTRSVGRIRHVIGLTRDMTHEAKELGAARQNEALLRSLGKALPSAIYLCNIRTRTIRFIGGGEGSEREQWRERLEDDDSLSATIFIHPEDHPKAEAHLIELAHLRDDEISECDYRIRGFDGVYRRHLNRETVFSRNAAGEVESVLGIAQDFSEQDRIRQEVLDLSGRLANLQTEERRRIAQELHDSTGQHLTAVGLALDRIDVSRAAPGDSRAREQAVTEAIDDARSSLKEAQAEIRVLSYLLHPPQIRSQGLGEAIERFAVGFGRRAGLNVDVYISPEADRVDDIVSLHLFRVCQEALTNVHRHAEASNAVVTVAVDDVRVTLTIADNGHGFDEEKLGSAMRLGIGLSGMRERLQQLGGSVDITSGDCGTKLVAIAPRSSMRLQNIVPR